MAEAPGLRKVSRGNSGTADTVVRSFVAASFEKRSNRAAKVVLEWIGVEFR